MDKNKSQNFATVNCAWLKRFIQIVALDKTVQELPRHKQTDRQAFW